MRMLEAIAAAVPQGKALVALIVGAIAMFGSGVGFAFGFGETAANIKLVPGIVAAQASFRVRLNTFEFRLDEGDEARSQILCLVRLTAAGETVTPLQVQVYLENPDECP